MQSKDIDVAVLKSTSARFHVVPKEKHVATLKMASSGSRASANYIASALLKRLHSATDWLTALKTLIVIHRLIRETDAAAFMEEMLRVGEGEAKGRGGRVLAMDNFLDTTNIEGRFDYSEWVRAYAKYLDEQLEVFSAVAWHVDLEGAGKESRLRTLTPSDLLRQLPYLQRLQRSLVDCVPKGQAMRDDVVLVRIRHRKLGKHVDCSFCFTGHCIAMFSTSLSSDCSCRCLWLCASRSVCTRH